MRYSTKPEAEILATLERAAGTPAVRAVRRVISD